MKTVALRFNSEELDELVRAFAVHLDGASQYEQGQNGLELLQLWIKLQDAARAVGSYMVEESDLPKWVHGKLREALRTASQVNELKAQVETLEARAKARGVTTAPQLPAVTKARKKPARKSRPKKELPIELQQPAPVS